MKRFVTYAVLMCAATMITGCFVWVKETCPAKPVPQQLESDPAIAEIDAVRKLTTNESRENILVEIAERENLSTRARIHLANSIDMLTTNESRENVLWTLANNEPQPEPAPGPQPENP